MTWYAAPFRDRGTLQVHVVLSQRERPKRKRHVYTLCAREIVPMQRLATGGRAVPTSCEACTRSLSGFVDLLGED